jgi:hypothetical protein
VGVFLKRDFSSQLVLHSKALKQSWNFKQQFKSCSAARSPTFFKKE